MSRRKHKSVDRSFFMVVQLACPLDGTHHLPMIVRQMGRDMLEVGIERIDGPNGETKLSVPCPTCRAGGSPHEHQVRWDRILAVFVDMESNGEHKRTFVLP